ncbi:type I-C CRISPR-associated protein Cas8c/Csd1 [Alkalispirochaeta sphaeroplastigenens]|uniref:Type I-C CRISPR-associated protein Cas8c/Csd1 n=1 Tax=Alkalispirochaeta sphaeroplastigenens TaxID=1187066 RepID=A0A2S4JGQ0_9SPIO|nr:type I-C CRISPR-associated protein Cas8c/Csd1 [Alkalispirochaeta sphaeroplastigenens]POQ98712.1 type I-C CRISPR-associated protein Cas8c/Csd1 [Alkalispirochaeta sphaeroplastigenens]
MILQELYTYYQRLNGDPGSGIAPPGYSPQNISWALVLDNDGNLVQIQDIRDTTGNKPRSVSMVVPEAVVKSVNIAANFLWDNTGYVLGADEKENPKRCLKTFEAFRAWNHEIGDGIDDEGMQAALRFLDAWDPANAPSVEGWAEIVGTNLVFRLEGERRYIHERPLVRDAWINAWTSGANDRGDEPLQEQVCLITGRRTNIARLHNKIKGVRNAQTMGAAIVSFNRDSFRSYGKTKGLNAPVGTNAAFAYTTALNHLLRFDSRQKIQIGDATTVFWAERTTPVENFLGFVIDPRETNLSDGETAASVGTYLQSIRSGKRPEGIDESIRFHILGLAPNASRLAVRFWHSGTVADLDKALGQHFRDLEIVREYENELEFPGIWHLLIETAPQHKSENIKPTLAGAMTRSILTGAAYPSYLLAALVDRIRADGKIGYYRAALIKAVLTRNARIQSKPMEVTKVLNESSTNVAYRLGRLFAVLEKAQTEAIPGANATIKDRFYSSASATPGVVFSQLLRMNQHHLAKLEQGPKVFKEKLIQEIVDGIDRFPSHLSLEDQGMFALGYYHQRKAFFTKSENANNTGDGE